MRSRFDRFQTIILKAASLLQLVGNAGRVTGLLELLERLSQRKVGETSKNIGYGDRIAFDGVDIISKMVILSRFVALSVSLIQKVSLLQLRRA